jgi:AcrR family transcriptional regulator
VDTKPRRPRRSTGEIRTLLVDAARALFLANGYEHTTTRDIAAKAGVTEKLLYTNFGTKADLFEAAVLESFTEIVEDYTTIWTAKDDGLTPEQRMSKLVNALFTLAEESRSLLRSALGSTEEPDALLLDRFAQTLQSMQGAAYEVIETEGYRYDPPASIAATAAMVFGMALMDDMLFPAGRRRPSRARRIDAMVQILSYGSFDNAER